MPKESSPLKIAFVGTSCTGKTTLFEHFRSQYAHNDKIAFSKEGARAYFQENPLPARFTVDVQRAIQERTIQNEKEAHKKDPNVIFCDSSTIDQCVYTRAGDDNEGAEELYKGISLWVPTYSKFYMLDPRDVPFQNDEVRKEPASFRQKVHDTFIEVFSEKKLSYEVLSGTVAERFQTVDRFIHSASQLKRSGQ